MKTSKAKYGSVKTVDRNGKLYLDFRVNGNRLRPALNLVANAQNLKAANLIASRIELDIATGDFDATLAKYLGQSKLEAKQAKPSTIALLDGFIQWRNEHGKTASDFEATERFIRANQATWANVATKLDSKGYAPRTHNRMVQHINDCYSALSQEYKIDKPILKKLKGKQKLADDRTPFTADELKLIVDAFATDRFCPKASRFKHSHYLPYVQFMLSTGCRPGEIVGLKVKHVDLVNNTIEISENLTKESNYSTKRVQKPTKTGSVRYFPIPKVLLKFFSETCNRRGKDEYIFLGPEGSPIDHSNFSQRIWKPILTGLGIPYRVPYAARHTMPSMAIEQGMPITQIAYLMGHSSTVMVMKQYGHMINKPSLPDIDLGAA